MLENLSLNLSTILGVQFQNPIHIFINIICLLPYSIYFITLSTQLYHVTPKKSVNLSKFLTETIIFNPYFIGRHKRTFFNGSVHSGNNKYTELVDPETFP